MDNSIKFIKMCEKAFEDIGFIDATYIGMGIPYDYMPNVYAKEYPRIVSYSFRIQIEHPKEKGWFQIYRQDQLQDMIFEIEPPHWTTVHTLLMVLENKMSGGTIDMTYITSMEQLLLAIVKYEKDHKIWDDEKGEWIDA